MAAGYGHACLDRLGAAGAVEPSLTWLEPKEILVPRTIALCYPRHRDASAEALTLMGAVQAQFERLMMTTRPTPHPADYAPASCVSRAGRSPPRR